MLSWSNLASNSTRLLGSAALSRPLHTAALLGIGAAIGALGHKALSQLKKTSKADPKKIPYPLTLANKAPIVICHRGSGYHPEHTIEGYQDVMLCEPDFIEFDVVATKDHELIIRHDVLLDGTTNVAGLAQFKERAATRLAPCHDGEPNEITGFFACDFDLSEIKSMSATQRWAWRNMVDDNGIKYEIPTVYEAACAIASQAKELGTNVGLYIETKRPEWHASIGLPLEQKLIHDIERSGFSGPIIIQSFEEGSLRIFKKEKPMWPRVKLCVDKPTATEYKVDVKEAIPFDSEVDSLQKFYSHIATYADGVGIWKDDLVHDPLLPPKTSNIVTAAHAHNLFVHLYTFRSDIKFLHRAYGGNPTEEYLSVDGVFSDFAEHAVHARDVFLALGNTYPFASLKLSKLRTKQEALVRKTESQRQKVLEGTGVEKATKYIREENAVPPPTGPTSASTPTS